MKHELDNTLVLLKEIKIYLENNSLGDTHLSNLPSWFWEEFGECINDIETYINKK